MSPRRTIGVDAGGTKLLVGVVGPDLAVGYRRHALWDGNGSNEVVEQMLAAVSAALDAAPDAMGVGFGIPALVDSRSGVARSSVHLPLEGIDLGAIARERFGLPAVVDNDANAAMLCEHRHGAARGASHAALLTIGTGIGGGLIIDGRLYRGADGFGAELGHMVVDVDGFPCAEGCPGIGCLEALVSGSAIGRAGEASELGLASAGQVTGRTVTEAALAGDAAGLSIVDHAGRSLGAGLVSIVNALNPEVIVIGGGVMALGELLLGPAREVVMERALRPSREAVRIVPAEFGEDAGMVGAALMAAGATEERAL
ncbi:MAG: glucokinase [Thermoleophilaceae bacterium]|jgi:glucokinase|nr:glucokinase [Thermoleophilaceae bacterium]